MRDPPQSERGANRGDEDHVGREGNEEYEEEKESGDDFSGESVGGGGRRPGNRHQGPIVQQEQGDHVLLLLTADQLTAAQQQQPESSHPFQHGTSLVTLTNITHQEGGYLISIISRVLQYCVVVMGTRWAPWIPAYSSLGTFSFLFVEET